MSVAELLADLDARDVKLARRGGRVILDAPVGVLSAADFKEVRALKRPLLPLLSNKRVVQRATAIATDLIRGKPDIGFARIYPAATEVEAQAGCCCSCGDRTRLALGFTCLDCRTAYEHLAIQPRLLVSSDLELRIGFSEEQRRSRWIENDEDPFACDED